MRGTVRKRTSSGTTEVPELPNPETTLSRLELFAEPHRIPRSRHKKSVEKRMPVECRSMKMDRERLKIMSD